MAKKNKPSKSTFGKGFKKDQEGISSNVVFPAGEYQATITSAIDAPNKAGNGANLAVTFLFTKGEFKGREFKCWYAYENPSQQAIDIAERGMKSLSLACGIDFVKWPKLGVDVIVKKKVVLTLSLKPAKGEKEAENDIRNIVSATEGKKGKKDKPKF